MPFRSFTSDSDDGAIGITGAGYRVGIVGVNNGQTEPPPDTPLGAGILGITHVPKAAGVFGANISTVPVDDGWFHGVGVQGNGYDAGVSGFSSFRHGVQGITSGQGAGVFGRNDGGRATSGLELASGVVGVTHVATGAGIYGVNKTEKFGEFRIPEDTTTVTVPLGVGVAGSGTGVGVQGNSERGHGMLAQSGAGSGIVATSARGQAVSAFSDNDIAVFAQGATFAGVFNGAVVVNNGPNPTTHGLSPSPVNGSIVINDGSLFVNKGDVILANADCAEDFQVSPTALYEPGTVMVMDGPELIRECSRAYDRQVVGVVSGAGGFSPGLVLDRHPEQEGRAPIALIGKVCCKVDANYGSIGLGDLLTTSPTPGHAMRVRDPARAFGAVIGKAMQPIASGTGLIAVMVMLQ